MNTKVKDALKSVLMVLVLVALAALAIYMPRRGTKETTKVSETELTVLEDRVTYHGAEETITITYYYLLNSSGDTLSWQTIPFENARGIVYMKGKGVYDCRGQKPVLLKRDEYRTLGNSFRLKAVKGREEVVILDVIGSERFVYNLRSKKLR